MSAHSLGRSAIANAIREVFGYLNKYRGKVFVVKIEDTLFDHPLFPLLIRDIVEDDAESRGLAIMSNNGWGMRALLPKDALRDIYTLYLSEVSGS